VSNPAVSNPAVSKPAVSKPAVSKPAVSNPAASKPAVSNPVTGKPVVEKTSSGPKTSEPKTSTAAKPGAKPILGKPVPTKPVAAQPEKSTAKRAAQKPEAIKDTSPDASAVPKASKSAPQKSAATAVVSEEDRAGQNEPQPMAKNGLKPAAKKVVERVMTAVLVEEAAPAQTPAQTAKATAKPKPIANDAAVSEKVSDKVLASGTPADAKGAKGKAKATIVSAMPAPVVPKDIPAIKEPPVVKEKAAPKPPPVVLKTVVPSTKNVPAMDANDPFVGIDEVSDADFLGQQRVLLLAERATYNNQAEMLRAEADQLAYDMEPGDVQFDDESGEGAGTSVERERDLAMSAQALQTVVEIDRALVRLDALVYGVCENCNTWILRARLRAMPYATLCVACKNGGLSRR
jgi:DnaK suppressor protein